MLVVNNSEMFNQVKICSMFKYMGELYLRIQTTYNKNEKYNAVKLNTTDLYYFMDYAIIEPVNAVFKLEK